MANNNHIQGGSERFSYYLKTIGILALAVGGLALATLLALLAFISGNAGSSYWEIVKSGSITRQSLGPGMLLAGLLLLGAAGILTWLVSLYASFRFAGPLFRFSRNLEMLIESDNARLTPIRKDDQLQQEARQLAQSAKRVQDHKRDIADVAEQALVQIESGETVLKHAVARLQELDQRARY